MIKANIYYNSYDEFLKGTYGDDLYRLRGDLMIADNTSRIIISDIPIIWALSEMQSKMKLSYESPSRDFIVSDDETYTLNLCTITNRTILYCERDSELEVDLDSFDFFQSIRKECLDIYFDFFQKSEKRESVKKVLFKDDVIGYSA